MSCLYLQKVLVLIENSSSFSILVENVYLCYVFVLRVHIYLEYIIFHYMFLTRTVSYCSYLYASYNLIFSFNNRLLMSV